MNDKKSTTDTEFIELKKLLKEIPKVKAPDNFEFNLMTKIQNGNLEVKHEKKKNFWRGALTPAIAFAASVFLILFVFNWGDEVGDNPWNIAPKLIQENVADLTPNESVKSDESFKEKKINQNSLNKNTIQYPLTKNNSYNLDEDIKTPNSRISNTGAATLAGANNAPLFDGFFIREVEKNKIVDSTKVNKDSTNADK